MKYRVLYNQLAGNKTAEGKAKAIAAFFPDDTVEFIPMASISDYKTYFSTYPEDAFIICGGDGTLNRFVNAIDEADIPDPIYYYAAGSGNDFWNDIGRKAGDAPVNIRQYLVNLPEVTINGKTLKFINGIGYGIDGYCCEEGDRLREISDKPVNYASIAIKGMLYAYKPANVTITVDGVTQSFKKAWLAPTMNGRYIGGGMKVAPNQDRLNPERKLTVLTWYDSPKLPTLIAFPGIFEGKHVNNKKCVFFEGNEITISYDRPVAAQIDGETVPGVTSVTVRSAKK